MAYQQLRRECGSVVVLILRGFQALGEQHLDRVGGPLDVELQLFAFDRAELAQYIIGRILPTRRPADPEPNPAVVPVAQRLADRFQPVVPALAATAFEAQ